MRNARFGNHPGETVSVHNVHGGYPLPEGLQPGDRVKLISFDHGYWLCEKDGKTFRIVMTAVDEHDK